MSLLEDVADVLEKLSEEDIFEKMSQHENKEQEQQHKLSSISDYFENKTGEKLSEETLSELKNSPNILNELEKISATKESISPLGEPVTKQTNTKHAFTNKQEQIQNAYDTFEASILELSK